MRNCKIGYALLFVLSAVISKAQTSEEKQVQQVIIDMFQGLADRDSDKTLKHCTEDLIILEHGVVWNTDSVVKVIDKMKGKDLKRINTINFTSTEIAGNVAWVYYDNQADITYNGNQRSIKWLESAVLVKHKDKWKIKLLHSTIVERKNY
jgi:ketosteroid isomerase-like protein